MSYSSVNLLEENPEICHFLGLGTKGSRGRLVEIPMDKYPNPRYIWNLNVKKSKQKPKVLRESNARRVTVVYLPDRVISHKGASGKEE